MDELSFQQQGVLELMKAHSVAAQESFRILDEKAKENINISSIIVGVVGVLNISQTASGNLSLNWLDALLSFGVFITLGLIFLLNIWVRRARSVASEPMIPKWEEMQKWLGLEKDDYYNKLISSYEDIIVDIKNASAEKGRFVNISNILLFVSIVLLIIAAAI